MPDLPLGHHLACSPRQRRYAGSCRSEYTTKASGSAFDAGLLDRLPPGVDPCGERGEFHTFAWAGPMFSGPVPVAAGEVVERDGFVFCDLLPG